MEVEYLPDKWWSDSVNHIDIYVSVINLGDTSLPKKKATFTFKVQQYFSVDDQLEEYRDIVQEVKEGDFEFTYQEDITAKQIVRSSLLTGENVFYHCKQM